MDSIRQKEINNLKLFLSQYSNAKRRLGTLENRLDNVRFDIDNPSIGSSIKSGTPSRSGGESGSERLVFLEDEIEREIKDQIVESKNAMLVVLNTIALIPPGIVEREILELRHIDCLTFSKITKIMYMSRSSCYDHYNIGLNILLELDTVRERIIRFEEKNRLK